MKRVPENEELSKKTFTINSDKDLVKIRDFGRRMAAQIGFSDLEQTLIATATSEICRNVLEYAGSGEIVIEPTSASKPAGIELTITDEGPGIKNIELALQEGYSTGKGLGIGLPGAKRIMDEFEIQSEMGKGTTVRMRKHLESYSF